MKELFLEATKFTPRIHFSIPDKKFEITGFSLPENVADVYMPAIKWLEEFEMKIQENSDIKSEKYNLDFKLTYFNSGSLRYIVDILKIANQLFTYGLDISVNWFYEDGDTQIRESGNELSEIVNLPFNVVEID